MLNVGLTWIANRFSILADLDQCSTQAKWAFDFISTPNRAIRRRYKRSGKQRKVRYGAHKNRKPRESEDMGELCANVAALCLDEPSKTTGDATGPHASVPQNDFMLPTDAVIDGLPTVHPNFGAPATAIGGAGRQETSSLSPPEHFLKEFNSLPFPIDKADSGRKNSDYIPFSAYVAGPPNIARQTPVFTGEGLGEKEPSIATSDPAESAAGLAACKILNLQTTDLSASGCLSSTHTPRSSTPIPLATTSQNFPPATPGISQPTSPHPLLPITPPQTASPKLLTSPIIPNIPSSSISLGIFPDVPSSQTLGSPPPYPLRSPHVSNTPRPWSVSNIESLAHISPVSLITAPVTSSRPFITPPSPLPAIVSTPSFVKAPGKIKPPVPKLLLPGNSSIFTKETERELADFLKMGHANPCWCSQASPHPHHSSSTIELPRQEVRSRLTIMRKRKDDESDVAAEMDAISLSPSDTSETSDFEDLGSTGPVALTPESDEAGEGWTVVPNDEGNSTPSPNLSSSSEHGVASDFEIVPRPPASSTFKPCTRLTINLPARNTSPSRLSAEKALLGPQLISLEGKEPETYSLKKAWAFPSDAPYEGTCGDCIACHSAGPLKTTGMIDWPTLEEAEFLTMMRHNAREKRIRESIGSRI